MGKLYTKDSIESLNPREFTRLKPQVYCGSTEYSTQLLVEIVSNAVDEFRAGHGSEIIVVINEDNSITVRDFGQGFLVGEVIQDGKTQLEISYSQINTSGKYREDGSYDGVSLGNFGFSVKAEVKIA